MSSCTRLLVACLLISTALGQRETVPSPQFRESQNQYPFMPAMAAAAPVTSYVAPGYPMGPAMVHPGYPAYGYGAPAPFAHPPMVAAPPMAYHPYAAGYPQAIHPYAPSYPAMPYPTVGHYFPSVAPMSFPPIIPVIMAPKSDSSSSTSGGNNSNAKEASNMPYGPNGSPPRFQSMWQMPGGMEPSMDGGHEYVTPDTTDGTEMNAAASSPPPASVMMAAPDNTPQGSNEHANFGLGTDINSFPSPFSGGIGGAVPFNPFSQESASTQAPQTASGFPVSQGFPGGNSFPQGFGGQPSYPQGFDSSSFGQPPYGGMPSFGSNGMEGQFGGGQAGAGYFGGAGAGAGGAAGLYGVANIGGGAMGGAGIGYPGFGGMDPSSMQGGGMMGGGMPGAPFQ
eukprot:GILK01015485.1.p1 GENE.GILK01015485.1~~GILK01015485.1.p1  ORF type:complete len:395 (-),score=12.87 GILK01015485.1:149-1333(-)